MLTRRTLQLSLLLFGTVAVMVRADQVRVEKRTRQVAEALSGLSAQAQGYSGKPDARISVAAFQREGVRIATRDGAGHTVLMYAARRGDDALLQYALSTGVDPSAADDAGYTAVTYAAMANRPDIISTLVQHGASPTGPPGAALTPLMDACVRGNFASITELLKLGALTPEQYPRTMALVEERERLWRGVSRRSAPGDYYARVAATNAARYRIVRQLLARSHPAD